MNIETSVFKLIDHDQEIYSIKIGNTLFSEEAKELRKFIEKCIGLDYENFYLNVSDVVQVDQSGIDEIVESFTKLQVASKKLTLVYRKGSEVEKWVEISELDKLIPIAILPPIL